MAFRARRQSRYAYLRSIGFLKVEAYSLSRVPLGIPYMRQLARDRIRFTKIADDLKWSGARRFDELRKFYRSRGLKDPKRMTFKDIWDFLRQYEHAYRNKHPEYTSPWEKRRKRMRDFVSKYERGEEKYPEGRAYRRKGR